MFSFPGTDHIEKIIELDFLDCDIYIDEGIAEYFTQLFAFGETM
jgi:hypothetical protein